MGTSSPLTLGNLNSQLLLLVTTRVSSLGVFLDRMEATPPAQARVQAQMQDRKSVV